MRVTRGGWHHPPAMRTTTVRTATAEERARLEEYLKPSRPGKPAWLAAVMVGLPATFAFKFVNRIGVTVYSNKIGFSETTIFVVV